MRGCLFTLLLGTVVLVLAVTIALPAIAAWMLTDAVGAAGLEAADTTVTVETDPPTELLGFHADQVRIRATNATFHGMQIGALDVTLTDVEPLARTAGGVSGRLTQVTVPNVGRRRLTLAAITLSGGGDAVIASTTVPGAQVRTLIADAVQLAVGTRPDAVTLAAPDQVTVTEGGATVHGRLVVTAAGGLVLEATDGPTAGQRMTLLTGGTDLPIRLTSATVTSGGGLRLVGDLTISLLG